MPSYIVQFWTSLIKRREALVYNTPEDHVTRDIREGIAKLGDLRFKVLDSAGLEMAAIGGSILHRTAAMTAKVIEKAQAALFLIDVRLVWPMVFDIIFKQNCDKFRILVLCKTLHFEQQKRSSC